VIPGSVLARIGELDPDDDLPAYLVDLAGLRAHAAAIRAALPAAVEFWYAAKANPEAPVLRALAGVVDGFEVASGGELAHVRATLPAARVCFGGPGKTGAELAAALAHRVERFHVESPHELRLLGWTARRLATGADVLLRLNLPVAAPGAVLSMAGPFGIDPALLPECRAVLAEYPELRLRGVHAHLASGLDAPALVEQAAAVLTHANHADGYGEVNLGGGMAVDYRRPDALFDWSVYGAGLRALARPGTVLRVEPGRAVTAYCGWYVTRVLDVKRNHGAAYAVLAGGTHQLRTPAARGHDQPFTVLPVDEWRWPWPRPEATGPVTLVGQLCTPKDVLARAVPVQRIRAGDVVAFAMAGAYGWNISHRDFLMHPPPAFHYLGS
jgi:diaminopimelate decarboxylase